MKTTEVKNIEYQIDVLERQFSNDFRKAERLKYIINYSKWRIRSVDHLANICNEISKLEERIESYRLKGSILLRRHKELTNTLIVKP